MLDIISTEVNFHIEPGQALCCMCHCFNLSSMVTSQQLSPAILNVPFYKYFLLESMVTDN